MDKTIWEETIEKVTAAIGDQRQRTNEQVAAANQASIESPTRMQSRYDSAREEYAMQAAAIASRIPGLRSLEDFLLSVLENGINVDGFESIMIGMIVKVDYGNNDIGYLLIVPIEGGYSIETSQGMVLTLSENSPLGFALVGKKKGDLVKYSVNKNAFSVKILDVFYK